MRPEIRDGKVKVVCSKPGCPYVGNSGTYGSKVELSRLDGQPVSAIGKEEISNLPSNYNPNNPFAKRNRK